MAESVYKVIELVGTSEESWEKAASAAVAKAAGSLRDLRIAEVVELDLQIESDGRRRGGGFGQPGANGHIREFRPARHLKHMKIAIAVTRIE